MWSKSKSWPCKSPRATIDEVAVEEEGVVLGREAGEAKHVVKIKKLAVQVSHHSHLRALGDGDSSEGFLLNEEVIAVDRHLVRVLHGQQLAGLVVREHCPDPVFVDRG